MQILLGARKNMPNICFSLTPSRIPKLIYLKLELVGQLPYETLQMNLVVFCRNTEKLSSLLTNIKELLKKSKSSQGMGKNLSFYCLQVELTIKLIYLIFLLLDLTILLAQIGSLAFRQPFYDQSQMFKESWMVFQISSQLK